MTLRTFLEIIEIKAKTASIFPFLLGGLYSWYHYQRFRPLELIICFIAVVLFNMAVDVDDNYQDYLRASNTQAFHYRLKTNIIGREHLSLTTVRWLIIGLTSVSALIGLWLTSRTGWPLLILGLFSFAVGFGYSGGPRPLSSTPFGELFSGFTMGFVIWLIAIYVSLGHLDWALCWRVYWSSGLVQGAIAALLLANNIADEDEDIALKRHTIVYYLGRRRASWLFGALYACGYISQIAAVWAGWLPKLCLLTLLTAIPVSIKVRGFLKHPVKRETFVFAIQNLLIITATECVTMALGVAFGV
ncbi:1,4-dihydroxy-2-naphthoate polyprenyltransferase [Lacticaseibacillus sp. GG6-2]